MPSYDLKEKLMVQLGSLIYIYVIEKKASNVYNAFPLPKKGISLTL